MKVETQTPKPIETVDQALMRAVFWIDTLIAYFEIDPGSTQVLMKLTHAGGNKTNIPVNLADDLARFRELGADQIISHDTGEVEL